jgi:glutamate synthase domain-containing protein 2
MQKKTRTNRKIRVKPQPFFLLPSHSAFHDATRLNKFVALLRELANGNPLALNYASDRPTSLNWFAKWFCKLFPDFITVDRRAERSCTIGISDGVGMPFKPTLIFMNKTLIRLDIQDKIRVICSGKIISGPPYRRAVAMGISAKCSFHIANYPCHHQAKVMYL